MEFSQLPNLPKPIIPTVDLNIQRMNLPSMLEYAKKKSEAIHRRAGFSVADRSVQTEQSDIIDVQEGMNVLEHLMQEANELRQDLNFVEVTLKANYEKQIQEHSEELHSKIYITTKELHKQYENKVRQVRKSFKAQLDNAIKQIAGRYKTYYDGILQGKTGHHDTMIKDLKEQLSEKEIISKQQEAQIETLEIRLKEFEANSEKDNMMESEVGFSQEEVDYLNKQIQDLEEELNALKKELASREDENRKLKKQNEGLNKKIENHKQKYKQLEKDMDNYKKNAKQEKEKAARMAQSQLAAMEKDMKDKLESTAKEAALKAQEEADMQRMRDQAKFQEEMDRRKAIEDQLKDQMNQQTTNTTEISEVETLNRMLEKQKQEILRLNKKFEKTNKIWELKMAVMKKNFHALKNEFHLRHQLERQSIQLHHATVGYASSGNSNTLQEHATEEKALVPKLKSRPCTSSNEQSTTMPATPLDVCRVSLNAPPSQGGSRKNVHFEQSQKVLTQRTDGVMMIDITQSS